MHDYDDYSQDSPNPFRRRGVARRLNGFLVAMARWGQGLLRPLHALGYWLSRIGAAVARTLEIRLGRVGAWLGDLSWRLVGWLRLDVVRRQVNTLQDTAARSVDELTMSVRERTTQASWVRRLSARCLEFFSRLGDVWQRFLAWAEQSWLTRALTAPVRWIGHLGYTLADFLIGWLWTRHYRHLLFGIPAILLVMPLAYCAVRLPFYTAEAKARHYRRAVSEALTAEDYASADLYFRKLAQLGDVHEQVVMRAALLAEEQGQVDEAYRQMQQIAPLEEPGVAQAHLWIAQRISAGQIEVNNPRAAELVERHVNHALNRGENDPVLNIWLAQIYLQTGRRDKCMAALDKTELKALNWQTRVVAADMFAALGQRERSREIASGADQYFRQQREDGAPLTVDDYLRWGVAAELQGNSNDALDVLQLGLEAQPNDPRLLEAIRRVGLAYFDNYRGNTPDAWNSRYEILQRLVAILPSSEPVLKRLAEMTLLPALAERAKQSLQAQQAAGPLPPDVEKTLGDAAIVNNDRAAAREHYRAALQRKPDGHAAANNLAYLLTNDEPRDLEQALQLADHAVRLQPENPHYLETRGQVYVKLQRWQEAAADLETALNGLPGKREIHASLAQAYHELGDERTAEMHAVQATR